MLVSFNFLLVLIPIPRMPAPGLYKLSLPCVCRVACRKSGGIRFSVNGFRYFNLVLISNVGGAGDVVRAAVKASHTEWLPLARNWGQNWQCSSILIGGALSFRVTTSDRRTLTSWNVAGPAWRFGQTFTAGNNFRIAAAR